MRAWLDESKPKTTSEWGSFISASDSVKGELSEELADWRKAGERHLASGKIEEARDMFERVLVGMVSGLLRGRTRVPRFTLSLSPASGAPCRRSD